MEDNSKIPHEQSNQEHLVRVEKVEKMRAKGIEPWPGFKEVSATCKELLESFKEGIEDSSTHTIAGRVLTIRSHGKTTFATIQDRSGRLQIYIKKDEVGDDAFNFFTDFVDIGDIVWFSGSTFKTKTGEITLKATSLTLLSKCLYPLPEKFHGLADIETKYRQRYLDLISDTDTKAKFIRRTLIMRYIREYLNNHGFLEVETPMLHPIPGGAAARPFITHHNAYDLDLYLRIAPELYLKRLVVGGLERVYEINRNFRNEGISTRHNPEFTMLEFYMAHQDYHFAMTFVEEMFRYAIKNSGGTLQTQYGNYSLDFEKPFRRLSMKQAVIEYAPCKPEELEGDKIDALLKKHNVHVDDKSASWGHKLSMLFEEVAEPHLVQPTFITDFPIEISPLSKRDPHNPDIASRFELYIACMELSNSFNELNDPFDQAARFREQAQERAAGAQETHYYDADFIHALEYGLPPTVGVGIGIDRLIMLLTNTTSIKDVILFPTLKPKQKG